MRGSPTAGAALIAAAAMTACTEPPADSSPPDSPNVVLVFVDDMGWGDAGNYGASDYQTPHLDRLAREGVRLSDFYAAQPVCSASRAALLTGLYPNRIGIHGALGPHARHGLRPDELTLGELFQSKGYATAIFGKWHLGHLPEHLPTRHGFDEYYGIPYSNDMWPHHPENPEHWGDLPTLEGEEVVGYNTDQRRFTTDFTERGVDFVERSVAAERSFFLYLAHPMPHVPLHVSEQRAGASGAGLYGDVIAEIDWSVGRLLATLERLGVDERTLLVFASDNGPWLSYGNHAGSSGPLREGKGTTFEGGVRVPALLRWPGGLPSGRVLSEPIMAIDVLPTLAGLLGVPLPERGVDGVDVWPLLAGEPGAALPERALFFYYGRNELQAMRSGRWKLHFPHGYRTMADRAPGRDGVPGKYDNGVRTELSLYDLSADIGEEIDVAEQHPDVLAWLSGLADEMRAELGDALTETEGTGLREPGAAETSQP